ncbi:hypothetical protein PIB30_074705 [Stylosanthes scabra]|uniref:TPX2 central domain-containing protein n=1 Tax=Stylosanthes scabra TaxID=79078 RepID=A0ABU6WPL0_9FABA|nr:hypothetical protein [Stylosanthes scabra]
MANMPKFKARPLNKKILHTSSLPPIPRSTPHPPQFKDNSWKVKSSIELEQVELVKAPKLMVHVAIICS